MNRRDFVTLLAMAGAWATAARAQQSAVPRIGFVHSAAPDYFTPFAEGFYAGLKEMGYVEKQNVEIEYRWAEGRYDRLPGLIAALLEQRVDVIFAGGGSDPARAAKRATTTTPVVFVSAADPIRIGLVESLNRPGGNITGVSMLASLLNGKRMELLRGLVPQATMIGGLINPNYPDAKEQSDEFKAAAAQLGVQSIVSFAGTSADIDIAFSTLRQQRVDAVLISNDPLYGARREQLVALAARHSVPTMHFQREFVAEGGLMSYGPSFADAYRQGGVYVGRVLKGEQPADLPVVQPVKFELILNLKTAKSLGLAVPPMVLALADEVIE